MIAAIVPAKALDQAKGRLAALLSEGERRDLALAMLEERKPGRRLYTNVEFYSAAVLAAVGLDGDMFTPTFAVARTVGWTAHVLEQVANNRLIRPQSEFVGPPDNPSAPIEDR